MPRNFKNLEIWKLSYQLALDLYKLVEKFPEEETNLKSQIKRAAISIPLNIAEGTGRYSKNAFLQFLSYAYGSVKELQVLMMFCRDLNYITSLEYSEYVTKMDILGRKLFLFMNKVKSQKFFNWFKNLF